MRWSTFREESPSLRQLLRRWKSEEIEERKWKAKWLESGLISMQNARLVLRVHAWSLVPPPPSFISNRQPCWIRAPNPFRILPSLSPSSLSLPYVSRLFYALVARWKRLRSYLYHSFPVYTLFSSYFLYKIYIKKKKATRDTSRPRNKKGKERGKRKKERKYIYRQNFSRTFSGNRQSLRSTSIHFPSIRFRRIKEDDTPPLSLTPSSTL